MLLISLFALLSCKKNYNSYRNTPQYIRAYLDSVYGGKFLIAEQGEEWNEGCVREEGVPGQQFVTSYFVGDEFRMETLSGGIAPRHPRTHRFKVKNDRVIEYNID